MTTKKKYRKISSTTKSQILSEALMPGCLISNLAKSYGVSRQIIYSWRKDYKAIKSKAGARVEAEAGRDVPEVQPQPQFVELLVQDSGGDPALKKASLIFSDFALTLEGRVKSSSLVAILKILEGEVITC